MADADDTAPACPSVNAIVSLPIVPHRPAHIASVVDDATWAVQIFAKALTRCLAECDRASHGDLPPVTRSDVIELTYALHILKEYEEAWRCSHGENHPHEDAA